MCVKMREGTPKHGQRKTEAEKEKEIVNSDLRGRAGVDLLCDRGIPGSFFGGVIGCAALSLAAYFVLKLIFPDRMEEAEKQPEQKPAETQPAQKPQPEPQKTEPQAAESKPMVSPVQASASPANKPAGHRPARRRRPAHAQKSREAAK